MGRALAEREPSGYIRGLSLFFTASIPDAYLGAIALFVAVGLYRFIEIFGMSQFAGWDYSNLVDYAWRLYLGQKPYTEFIATYPPGFFLPAWLAFVFSGVTWRSLVLLTATFSALSFVWQVAIFRALKLSALFSLLIPLMVQCVTNVVMCFWWYNSIAQVCAVIFITSAFFLVKEQESVAARLSFVASESLFALQKPNVACPLLILTVVALLVGRTRKLVIALSLIAGLLDLACLGAAGINPIELVRTYFALVHARDPNWGYYYTSQLGMGDVFLAFTVFFALLPFLSLLLRRQRTSPLALRLPVEFKWYLLGCVVATSVYFSLTNTEFRCVDGCLLAAMASVLVVDDVAAVLPTFGMSKVLPVRYLLILSVLFLGIIDFGLLGTRIGVERIRVRGCDIFGNSDWTVPVTGIPFLVGLQASPLLAQTGNELYAVVQAARKNNVGTSEIFLGPRLEWAYAAFRLSSPSDLPISWWKNILYFGDSEDKLIENFERHRFKVCILSRVCYEDGRPLTVPVKLRKVLRDQFREVHWRHLVIEMSKDSSMDALFAQFEHESESHSKDERAGGCIQIGAGVT